MVFQYPWIATVSSNPIFLRMPAMFVTPVTLFHAMAQTMPHPISLMSSTHLEHMIEPMPCPLAESRTETESNRPILSMDRTSSLSGQSGRCRNSSSPSGPNT